MSEPDGTTDTTTTTTDDTSGTETEQQQAADGSSSDTEQESTDWAAEAAKLRAEADKWRNLARKHEDRARQNASAATQAKSLEQQVADLQQAMADRDVRETERSATLALAQVRTAVAEAGIRPDRVEGFLDKIDPGQLLDTKGQPDDKAIKDFAKSLVNLTGRATPDPDQGQRGGPAPKDMNSIIRRAAGITP